MSKDTVTPDPVTPTPAVPSSKPLLLNLQNGMPAISESRSRELLYDTLEGNARFIKNPYGPQWLLYSRTTHKWN